MSVRPQIPALEGLKDAQLAAILGPIKTILETITGRLPNRQQIAMLGTNPTLGAVGNKVNELIARLQDTAVSSAPAAAAAAADTSGLRAKVITFTRAPGAANGSVSYTGVGFRPSALIGFGASAGTNIGFNGVSANGSDGASLFDGGAFLYASGAFLTIGVSAANQSGTVTSYDADGFTISWVKNGAPGGADYSIAVLCLR